NPDDFVRIEVEAGLNRNDVLVIPVLVKGAGMPSSADLPPTMRELAYRNGAVVRDDPDFHRDMNRLIKQIDEYIKARPKKAASRPPAVAIQSQPQTPPSKAPSRSGVNPMVYIGVLGLVVVTVVAILLVLSGNNGNDASSASTPTHSDKDNVTAAPSHDGSDDMIFPLGEPIPIGVLLTSENAAEHDDILRGIDLALVEHPIDVSGETIEVRWENAESFCDTNAVEENISALLDSGVAGFIGPTCDAACERAAEILHEVDGVMISPACDAASLSFLGTTSFYRTIPSLGDVGWLLAKMFLEDLDFTDVVVIHGDTQRSIDVMNAFTDGFSEQGGSVYTALALPDVPDMDFTPVIQTIQESGADAVYFTGTMESAVALASMMKELGVDTQLVLHGDYPPEEFIDMAGEFAEDVYFVGITPPNNDEFQDWLNRFSGMTGEEPNHLTALYAYDAATIFLNAIRDLAFIEDDTIHIPRQDFQAYVGSYTDTTVSGFIDCSLGGNCGFLNLAILHYHANELNVAVQRDDRPDK
ncbi:MAG: amino acid ABC transporter substrate-binding protein, partial [Chloroflexi bacterium]